MVSFTLFSPAAAFAALLLVAQSSVAAPSASLEARQLPGGAPLHVIQLKAGSNKTASSSNTVATFNNAGSVLVSGNTGNSYGFGVNTVSKASGSTPEIVQVFASGITCIGAHKPSGASSIILTDCSDATATHFYSRPYTIDGQPYRQLEVVAGERRNVHIVGSGEVHYTTESGSYPQRLYLYDQSNA